MYENSRSSSSDVVTYPTMSRTDDNNDDNDDDDDTKQYQKKKKRTRLFGEIPKKSFRYNEGSCVLPPLVRKKKKASSTALRGGGGRYDDNTMMVKGQERGEPLLLSNHRHEQKRTTSTTSANRNNGNADIALSSPSLHQQQCTSTSPLEEIETNGLVSRMATPNTNRSNISMRIPAHHHRHPYHQQQQQQHDHHSTVASSSLSFFSSSHQRRQQHRGEHGGDDGYDSVEAEESDMVDNNNKNNNTGSRRCVSSLSGFTTKQNMTVSERLEPLLMSHRRYQDDDDRDVGKQSQHHHRGGNGSLGDFFLTKERSSSVSMVHRSIGGGGLSEQQNSRGSFLNNRKQSMSTRSLSVLKMVTTSLGGINQQHSEHHVEFHEACAYAEEKFSELYTYQRNRYQASFGKGGKDGGDGGAKAHGLNTQESLAFELSGGVSGVGGDSPRLADPKAQRIKEIKAKHAAFVAKKKKENTPVIRRVEESNEHSVDTHHHRGHSDRVTTVGHSSKEEMEEVPCFATEKQMVTEPKTYIQRKLYELKADPERWVDFQGEVDEMQREKRSLSSQHILERNVTSTMEHHPSIRREREAQRYQERDQHIKEVQESKKIREKTVVTASDKQQERHNKQSEKLLVFVAFAARLQQLMDVMRHKRNIGKSPAFSIALTSMKQCRKDANIRKNGYLRDSLFQRMSPIEALNVLSAFIWRCVQKKRNSKYKHVAVEHIKNFLKALSYRRILSKSKEYTRFVVMCQRWWRHQMRSIDLITSLRISKWEKFARTKLFDLRSKCEKQQQQQKKKTSDDESQQNGEQEESPNVPKDEAKESATQEQDNVDEMQLEALQAAATSGDIIIKQLLQEYRRTSGKNSKEGGDTFHSAVLDASDASGGSLLSKRERRVNIPLSCCFANLTNEGILDMLVRKRQGEKKMRASRRRKKKSLSDSSSSLMSDATNKPHRTSSLKWA